MSEPASMTLLPSLLTDGESLDTSSALLAYLRDRTGWLIRLRWLAVAAIGMIVALAHLSGSVETGLPLTLVAGSLGLANLGFLAVHRRTGPKDALPWRQRHIFTQLLVDVLALALLLHWSDGVENPFSLFFAFHVAIAAKLLPSRMAYAVAGAATVLQGGIVLAEHLGLLAHHSFFPSDKEPHHDPVIESAPYLVAWLLAFSSTLFGMVFFMATSARRYHEALEVQARLERLAASRERFARLGELSGGMAHSLRNPLHGVISNLDLLRAQLPAKADPTETLDQMEEGLGRMQALTQRLLSFARDVPIRRAETELGPLVHEAVRFFQGGARASDTTVMIEAAPEVFAQVDAHQLTEALLNVLDNAADASGPGGTVWIELRGDGEGATIQVRDHGPGIAAEDLRQVFNPFFSKKPVGQGTGLGLAITRRIVEEHGGHVNISSELGVGTTVRLWIPAEVKA